MIRLNVGCGEFYAPGWVNVDLESCPHHKDVIADVRALPFEDASAERVYAGHVLEHVAAKDVPVALSEIRRVLASGSLLLVVGPGNDEPGAGRWDGDHHLWACNATSLLEFVASVFPDCAPVSLDAIDCAAWPLVSHVDWQCAVTAQK